MNGLVLTGLDGSNPLAFLAALGTLRVLDDHAPPGRAPRLSWREEGVWRPVLHGCGGMAEVIDRVLRDRDTWRNEPALEFAYSKEGAPVAPDAPGAVRDLKPPLPLMRELFDRAAEAAAQGAGRTARQVAAYATDVATDNSGKTKPTALHFTAGQQTFLDAVVGLRDGLDAQELREALEGPWLRASTKKTLGWDPLGATGARPYALRASDPSKEKRPCVPGAEWLAFLGMSFLPSVPVRDRIHTACVRGGWKDGEFVWPIWTVPASARVVECLLRAGEFVSLGAGERAGRGIAAVLGARILRSDQGGYGSFSPTRVL